MESVDGFSICALASRHSPQLTSVVHSNGAIDTWWSDEISERDDPVILFLFCSPLSFSLLIIVINNDFSSSFFFPLVQLVIVLRQPSSMFAHPTVRNSCKASSSSPVRRIYTTTEPVIRFIEYDLDRRREKYDGSRWRLVCTWNDGDCTNFAYSCKLCKRHNALRRNQPPRKYTKKSSLLPPGEWNDPGHGN